MQRAYVLTPGNYYAVHTAGGAYMDAYYICDGVDEGFRIFGLVKPKDIIALLGGLCNNQYDPPNHDKYYATRHKTKIFESLDYRQTIADDSEFKKLRVKFEENNMATLKYRNDEIERQLKIVTDEAGRKAEQAKDRDNETIINAGVVIGRYYSITAGPGGSINAYLICTEKEDTNNLIFGIMPPSDINTMLNQNPRMTTDRRIVAIRINITIHTRTADLASEAGSPDFGTMRNLLMSRLDFPEEDTRRNFVVTADDTLTPAVSPDNTATPEIDIILEKGVDIKISEALKKLNDILNKIKDSVSSVQEELNR